jgi:hypothetical protein
VKNANDDQLVSNRQVIDGVGRMKNHAQARAELLAPGTDQWRMQKWVEFRFDGLQEARGDGLGRFCGDVSPDLGEILLGCIG